MLVAQYCLIIVHFTLTPENRSLSEYVFLLHLAVGVGGIYQSL